MKTVRVCEVTPTTLTYYTLREDVWLLLKPIQSVGLHFGKKYSLREAIALLPEAMADGVLMIDTQENTASDGIRGLHAVRTYRDEYIG